MKLKDLIAVLESLPPDDVMPLGFWGKGHCDRGDYSNLAFDATKNITVAGMLECARAVIGEVREGWKGGDYTMGLETEVFVGEYGDSGVSASYYVLTWLVPHIYPSDTTWDLDICADAIVEKWKEELRHQAETPKPITYYVCGMCDKPTTVKPRGELLVSDCHGSVVHVEQATT